jgi:hypothetical protein
MPKLRAFSAYFDGDVVKVVRSPCGAGRSRKEALELLVIRCRNGLVAAEHALDTAQRHLKDAIRALNQHS